tara:strand:+ start:397 stop:936 length:540 start_codon:yes stop_codon:yes gene_type:complete
VKNHFLFEARSFPDERGYFYESFSKAIHKKLDQNFVQDNISFSHAGVTRGLHYQWNEPMGKLVQTISGKIIDYIVDIREGSPGFGKYWNFELSEENRNILWVPPGYAHGFEALEDSYVMYKCTSYYNKEGESGINFLDSDIGINLKTNKNDVILSCKDLEAQVLFQYASDPKFFYESDT